MAMSVKMMRLFNRVRALAAEAEKEIQMLDKRWAGYEKILRTARARQTERMRLLGMSLEDIEAWIRSGRLNKKGVEMFLERIPGGGQGLDKLPGDLPLLARYQKPSADQAAKQNQVKRNTRVKFNL